MYLAKLSLRLPEKHILMSPWVDLLMDNPEIPEYQKNDPTLKRGELLVEAFYWANGSDLKDYRLSPIYGDVSCLKDVTLFVGTHEFFYPDVMKFSKILEEHKIPNRVCVAKDSTTSIRPFRSRKRMRRSQRCVRSSMRPRLCIRIASLYLKMIRLQTLKGAQ